MSLINIKNLTFSYEGSYDNVFENLTLQIDTDWKLGFTGRNGRGKTTFLKLLMRKYEYSGTISTDAQFDYFPFHINDKSAMTLDVVSGLSPASEDWEIIKELSKLQVSAEVLYRPFGTLSNGEQTKVLLASLFLKENAFLLIDEPTNHLDADARLALGKYLNTKKGFILVSHDRALLDRCTDHTLAVNKTGIEIQKGNFSSWWANKELKDEFEKKQNEQLKKEINRLNEAARRSAAWSDKTEKSKKGSLNSGLRPDRGYIGHKSAKMMQRAKSIENRREEAAAEKTKLLKNIESDEELKLSSRSDGPERLAELKNISILYGGSVILNNINFSIMKGDRISLRGKNGCGKSSILKLILGEKIEYTGELRKSSGLIISYVPQDTSFLKGGFKAFINENGIDETLFKAILRKLDFERAQFDKDISALSTGQKKKVMLAKSLCEQAHLYIWDEPLNFIDVISRMQIERLLLKYRPTLLFVEHDAEFCKNIETKSVLLK